MHRRSSGLLLPGLLLTFLATFGVVVLFAVGSPVLPGAPEGVPVSGQSRGGVSVTVPSPTPEPTPSATARTSPPRRTAPPATRTSAPATRPPTTRPSSRAAVPPAPSCRAGSATVPAVADAYVDQSSPKRNYGDEGTLAVASRDKGRNRRALIRFAFPAVPKGCTLRSATLSLTPNEASGRRVLVSRASRSWSEGGVTWSTTPSPAGAAVSAAVSGKRVSWNVTALVLAMRSGPNFGFVLRDAAESRKNVPQTAFADRSTRKTPTLTLRWS